MARMLEEAGASMSANRCECCDLPIESCGKEIEQHQIAEHAAANAELMTRGWFPAKYPGECAACGSPFDTNDMIRLHTTTGAHRCYIAECCKEEIAC